MPDHYRNPEIGEYWRVTVPNARVFAAPPSVITRIGEGGYKEINSTYHFVVENDKAMIVGRSDSFVVAHLADPLGYHGSIRRIYNSVVYFLVGNKVMACGTSDFRHSFTPIDLAKEASKAWSSVP